jgi:hypothetical protein
MSTEDVEAQAPMSTGQVDAVGSTPSPTMNEAVAWQLIDDARGTAGTDTSRQSELIKETLMRLDPQVIVAFATIWRRLDERAFSWNIWGAASVIEDGCSDDCFRDFRSYLISLGRGPYEAALRDPDSLATVVEGPEQGDWENADNVAGDAYSSVTGEDLPLDDSDLTGRPSGRRWTEAELPRLYPRLTARFR